MVSLELIRILSLVSKKICFDYYWYYYYYWHYYYYYYYYFDSDNTLAGYCSVDLVGNDVLYCSRARRTLNARDCWKDSVGSADQSQKQIEQMVA